MGLDGGFLAAYIACRTTGRLMKGHVVATMPMVTAWADMAEEHPQRPAITVGGGESVSWVVLHRRTNRLARRYAARGVRPGSLVTIMLPNGVPVVEALMAVLKLGAIPNPISPRLPTAELDQLIDLARPSLVVSSHQEDAAGLPWEGPDPDLDGFDDADLPVVVSTSYKAPTSGGSTGRPKIILSGQAAVVDPRPESVLRLCGYPYEGTCLFPGPMYHNTAVLGLLQGLSLRNHVVLQERFDPELTLQQIERHGVEFAVLVPTMMNRIWRLPQESRRRYDLSSLRVMLHNAAPCPPELKRSWIDWLGPERILENYSATEQAAMTLSDGREWLARPGTVGKVFTGEMEIRSDDGSSCGPGEVGTIWMRRPEGTPPTYRYIGQEVPEAPDRWETVGDLGHFDEAGYLFLDDRRTDLIISGGANIYPAEVEAALAAHPAVIEAVVVGLPDEDLGQRVHAIVSSSEASLGSEELSAFLAKRLVRYKTPRSYEFIEGPLRDDAGKVRRSALVAARVLASQSIKRS